MGKREGGRALEPGLREMFNLYFSCLFSLLKRFAYWEAKIEGSQFKASPDKEN
jgi:hypothetical protein